MKDDILKIIEASLPTLAAGELKTYIENSEKDKKALEVANFNVDDLKEKVSTLSTELTGVNMKNNFLAEENEKWKKQEEDIVKREEALYKKEKDLEIEAERKVSGVYKEVFNLVFTNSSIKEKIEKSVVVKSGGYMGYDNYGKQVPMEGQESVQRVEDIKTTTVE